MSAMRIITTTVMAGLDPAMTGLGLEAWGTKCC
jgi:hypothetical protein